MIERLELLRGCATVVAHAGHVTLSNRTVATIDILRTRNGALCIAAINGAEAVAGQHVSYKPHVVQP